MAGLFSLRRPLLCRPYWSPKVFLSSGGARESEKRKEVPSAALKVLKSTIGPTERPMWLGLSRSDPLAPRTRKQADEFKVAMDAGKKAAEYVISRWPRLVDEIGPTRLLPARRKFKGANEETLRYMIETRKTGRALKMIEKLRQKGVAISLDAQNEMLDLLAYYGIGNQWVDARKEKAGSRKSKLEEEEEAEEEEEIQTQGGSERVWSDENQAEKFFSDMEVKDAGSYEAMICGMVRYGAAEKAFSLFKEMRAAGMQPGVLTYNNLLSCVGDVKQGPVERWRAAEELISQMADVKAPVKPNTITLSILLRLCSRLRGERAECALKTMREFTHIGVKPSLSSYEALLRSCVATKRPGVLYAIVEHLERDPSSIERAVEEEDGEFFGLAISAARLLESGSLAERLYALASSHDWKPMGNPSEFLSHCFITVSHYGDFETAMRFYNECVPRVFIPRHFVYVALFRACRDDGRATAHAIALWRDVQRFGVRIAPKTQLYNRVTGALWSYKTDPRVRQEEVFECAVEVMDVMRLDKHTPNSYSLGQLVMLCCEVESLENAWALVLECQGRGEDIGYQGIVSLLEKSVEVGQRDIALDVLRYMVENNMSARPNQLDAVRRRLGLSEEQVNEWEDIKTKMGAMEWKKRESYSQDV